MRIDKTKIASCERCCNFTNVGVGWCMLLKKNTSPRNFCDLFNFIPGEEILDAGTEVARGADMSLEEIDDLDGDDDNTWATSIPCPR